LETLLKKTIPFAVAAVLAAVGVYGLQLNWSLAAKGFETLPGLSGAERLNYVLAMLPTALQAYLWTLKRGLSFREFLEQHFYWAVGGFVATAFEVSFVRIGLAERELADMALAGVQSPKLTANQNALLGLEAVFICLIAELLLLNAIFIAQRGVRDILPQRKQAQERAVE